MDNLNIVATIILKHEVRTLVLKIIILSLIFISSYMATPSWQ